MPPDSQTSLSVRALQPGLVLGRYVVVDRIGAGGMAELYLGRIDGPLGFHKAVALKLLHRHLTDDPEFVRMFEKEARIAATLDHPNVAQVLDVDCHGGEHFLVLEYVHGRDLRKVLATGGRLPLGPALRVIIDIARALHHAHGKTDDEGRLLGLVHRDVSPANVLVGFGGVVKLTDFGIAKVAEQTAHTSTGTLKGKFGYMAPEQYLQEPVDARSDVYALGVVLYEATTGRRAFYGEQTFTIMNKVLAGEIAPPSAIVPGYPTALEAIVDRALALEREERFASAAALGDALERFAADAGIDVRPETLATHVRELFGDPHAPTLDVSPLRSPPDATLVLRPETSSVRRLRKRSSWQRATAVGALVAIGVAAGSLAGWRAARSASEVDSNAQIPASMVPVTSAESHEVIAPRAVPPLPTTTVAEPIAPPLREPTAATRTDEHHATLPVKKKRKPKTKRTRDDPPTPTERPRESWLPKGMR